MINSPEILTDLPALDEAAPIDTAHANSRVPMLDAGGSASEWPARVLNLDLADNGRMGSGESPERRIGLGLPGDGNEVPVAMAAHGTKALSAPDHGLTRTGTDGHGLASAAATDDEWKEARERECVCIEFARLVAGGLSLVQAARVLGRSPSWFSGDDAPFVRWSRLGLAGLLPERRRAGAHAGELTRLIEGLGWFVPAAAFFWMNTNRTWDSGSVPEAVRRTISLPVLPLGWTRAYTLRFLRVVYGDDGLARTGMDLHGLAVPVCPPELREMILARQAAGMDLVPATIAKRIVKSKALVEFTRNPTNASLRTMNAAGGSRFTRSNGDYVPLRCGGRMQPDDGSINFCCWVPWSFPSDPVSRKYGCLVGRFQLLLFVDALSLAIRARSFVVRPRSSYRQEDALHLYNVFMREHGVPDEIWHEGHVWNSGRVKDCLDLLKVRRQLTHSPHNKAAVEGRFNKLWTVLSGCTGGQIGRFRGEMARENELLVSVRGGHTDPRRVFPSLAVALAVIDQAIAETNATPVKTDVGMWVPEELWAEQLGATPLRQLEDGTEWMFAPYCLERVINNGITTKVPLFEDFSVPFTFASEWMPSYHGARARVYFDPYMDKCRGKVVLAQAWGNQPAGTVLGDATQTNDIGEYARLMLGIGNGPSDAGRVMRQRQAAAMRSDRRAVTGTGRGLTIVEERDGVGAAAKWEGAGKGNTDSRGPARTDTDLMGEAKPLSGSAENDPAFDDFR